jgi:hypothetical protein
MLRVAISVDYLRLYIKSAYTIIGTMMDRVVVWSIGEDGVLRIMPSW